MANMELISIELMVIHVVVIHAANALILADPAGEMPH
jgi:hypothetical protein